MTVVFKPTQPYNEVNAIASALNSKTKLSFFEYVALYGERFIYSNVFTQSFYAHELVSDFIIPTGKILVVISIQHSIEQRDLSTQFTGRSAFGWDTGANHPDAYKKHFTNLGSQSTPQLQDCVNDRINYSIPVILKPQNKLWRLLGADVATNHSIVIEGLLIDSSILNVYN